MSPLDMRTIVVGCMVTNVVCVCFVVLLWRQNRNRFGGMAFWAVDFVFQAVALFLIVMRGIIPDWISMVLSNTLVIVGAILGFMGLERFAGKKGPQIHNYILVVLFIFVHSYFALVQPNLPARNLNLAVASLLVCFQSVWLVWRRVNPGMRSMIFGVGVVTFLYCLLSSVRIAHFFITPRVDGNYLQPAIFEALVLMSHQVLFILLTYSVVLMVNKRLLMDIGSQEEKFSKAFHSAPYAITLTRPVDGKIIEVNECFFAITGYDRAEVLGRNTIELNLWEREEDRATVVDTLSRTGNVQGMELRFRKKSGDLLTGIFSAEMLTIGDEKIILSSISDVTDRKQAEEAGHQSRVTADRISEEIAIIAKIGRVVGSTLDLNQVFERVTTETHKLIPFDRCLVNLKKTPEGQFVAAYVSGIANPRRKEGDLYSSQGSATGVVMNTRAGLLIQPDDAEEIKDLYPNLYETFKTGLRSTMSVPLISMDEVIGSMNFRSQKLKAYTEKDLQLAEQIGMQVAGAIANAQMFDDLSRTEKSLRESERRFRALVEQAAVGVAEIEMSTGRFSTVNRRLCEMVGRTEEEMLATTFHAITHPEDLHLHEEPTALLLAGTIAHYGLEKRYLRKDGETVWVNITASPLWKPGENSGFNMIVVEEITARKQAEEEKQNLEERLQRSEKMEALGTLAGGVAHDLNNVLGIVVGYAELILMNEEESSPIKSHLVNIMKGGLKAAAIVDDLLTLARRGVSGREVLNLNKIIADCQNSPELEKLFSYHPSVKIKTDLEQNLSNISGSSVHLVKSLYNLISNASEAMAKGGLLTIRTSNQYLDKPIHGYDQIREGDYVVLSVSDTGEGIPAANLKRIFEPFYTKKVMGRSGTGLGLAVVWGTVKDLHGYINVESEEGRGSTFTLYFPVTQEEIAAEAVSVAISEYMGQGESILIVDDVEEQRDLASSILRMLNYTVSSVPSGEEAVAYLKEHQVDLIVLDMIMDPGMDGLDTYRSILTIHPKQKAIIVSGFSESERVKAARDLGVGAYMRKPYIKEKMGLAVRKELDRAAGTRAAE